MRIIHRRTSRLVHLIDSSEPDFLDADLRPEGRLSVRELLADEDVRRQLLWEMARGIDPLNASLWSHHSLRRRVEQLLARGQWRAVVYTPLQPPVPLVEVEEVAESTPAPAPTSAPPPQTHSVCTNPACSGAFAEASETGAALVARSAGC